jgi:hypothetical protein
MPQHPELLAIELRQAQEIAKLREAQEAIKHTEPGPERETVRSLIDRGLEAVRSVGRERTLWWLGRSKMPGVTLEEAKQAVEEALDAKGYWNVRTLHVKNRALHVRYEDGEGKHLLKTRFHKAEKDAFALPDAKDLSPEQLEEIANSVGKTIQGGELADVADETCEECTIECDDGEPAACGLAAEGNGPVVIPNGGHLVQENYGQGRVEVGPEDMAEWLRQQKKEEPVKEETVEIKVADPGILAVLKESRDTGKTVLVNYQNQDGTAKGRLIKVIAISTDEKRFNVFDGTSGEVRKGWFVESVLQAYPSVTDIGKYANCIQGYGKENHTSAVTPIAGNPLTRKWGKTHWTTPEQAERLVATGNWTRLV